MSLASLLPVGGAAAGLVAAGALRGLADGLSFKRLLAGGNSEPSGSPHMPASPQVTIQLSEAVPQFVSVLRERLQAARIDLSHPLTLKEDGGGGVVVDGEHPDREEIERILNQEPELVAEFQAIATAATDRRRSAPSLDNVFGEFRLQLNHHSAGIGFE